MKKDNSEGSQATYGESLLLFWLQLRVLWHLKFLQHPFAFEFLWSFEDVREEISGPLWWFESSKTVKSGEYSEIRAHSFLVNALRFFSDPLGFFGNWFERIVGVAELLFCTGRTATNKRADESGDILERWSCLLAYGLALRFERSHFTEESCKRAPHPFHILGGRQLGEMAIMGYCHRLTVLCSHLFQYVPFVNASKLETRLLFSNNKLLIRIQLLCFDMMQQVEYFHLIWLIINWINL